MLELFWCNLNNYPQMDTTCTCWDIHMVCWSTPRTFPTIRVDNSCYLVRPCSSLQESPNNSYGSSNSCWVYWAGPMLSWVRQKCILLEWVARLAFNRLVCLLKDVFQSSFEAKIGCGDWIDFFLQQKIQFRVWKLILKPGLHESQSTPKQVRRLQWRGAFSRNWKFWLLKW